MHIDYSVPPPKFKGGLVNSYGYLSMHLPPHLWICTGSGTQSLGSHVKCSLISFPKACGTWVGVILLSPLPSLCGSRACSGHIPPPQPPQETLGQSQPLTVSTVLCADCVVVLRIKEWQVQWNGAREKEGEALPLGIGRRP